MRQPFYFELVHVKIVEIFFGRAAVYVSSSLACLQPGRRRTLVLLDPGYCSARSITGAYNLTLTSAVKLPALSPLCCQMLYRTSE